MDVFELIPQPDVRSGVAVVCNGALVGVIEVDPPEHTSAFTFHAEHHTAVTWSDRRVTAPAPIGVLPGGAWGT